MSQRKKTREEISSDEDLQDQAPMNDETDDGLEIDQIEAEDSKKKQRVQQAEAIEKVEVKKEEDQSKALVPATKRRVPVFPVEEREKPSSTRDQFLQAKRIISKNKTLRRALNQDVIKISSELRELKNANNELVTKSKELEQRIQYQLQEKAALEARLQDVETNIQQDSQMKAEINSLKQEITNIIRQHSDDLRSINNDLKSEESELIDMLRRFDEKSFRKQMIENIENDLLGYYEGEVGKPLESMSTNDLLQSVSQLERIIDNASKMTNERLQSEIDKVLRKNK